VSLDSTTINQIKAATRDLVRCCGGVERAGEIAGLSTSEVSRLQSPSAASVISIPAALALEADCGVPYVTAVMARLNGRGLTDPDGSAAGGGVLGAFSSMSEAFAGVVSTFAGAVADGTMTPSEAEGIDRVTGRLVGCVDQLRHELARAKGEVVELDGRRRRT
jgi:hypothetical protein